MNPDRYSKPRQELRPSDPEQLTVVRRSIPKRPDDNPSMGVTGQPSGSYMSPTYFLTIIPTDPSKLPRVVPVYLNDCITLVANTQCARLRRLRSSIEAYACTGVLSEPMSC